MVGDARIDERVQKIGQQLPCQREIQAATAGSAS
jgi:hypothetical protein